MEFEATINKANILYVPKDIRKILGEEIILITAGSCVLMVPSKSNNKTQLDSIDILKKEIQLKNNKPKNNNGDLREF